MVVKIAQHQTTILQNQFNLDCQIKKIMLQKLNLAIAQLSSQTFTKTIFSSLSSEATKK